MRVWSNNDFVAAFFCLLLFVSKFDEVRSDRGMCWNINYDLSLGDLLRAVLPRRREMKKTLPIDHVEPFATPESISV